MTELEQYIQSYFGVRPEDLAAISGFFKETRLEKGDYFLKAGRSCRQMSFIRSGMLRIYVDTGDREVTQWISTKGYFVTDLAAFTFQTPARWNIQALAPCELFTIERRDYERLGQLIPQWHELEKLFIARCFSMLEDRIFSHLSMSAEERYQLLFDNQRELFTQVPLQYLASMTGMTPETFSRIRRKNLS